MTTIPFALLVAGGLVASILGLASPALAMPTGDGSVQDTVDKLQPNGYKVILNRVVAHR
jgi:hypothetical protein